MIQLAYTPQWFYDKEIVIDVASSLVVLLIAAFSFRYYKMSKGNHSYLYLSIAFGFLAASFIAKTLTNFTIYHEVINTHQVGNVLLTIKQVESSNILFLIGFFMFRMLTLLGFYLLYCIYQKKQASGVVFLIVFLLLVSTLFSSSVHYVFRITAFLLVLLIIFELWKRFSSNRNNFTKWLLVSFAFIAASQFLFIFIDADDLFYVLAHILKLLGYSTLLVTFIRVLRHGKTR
jgi:hypothetical protein